jgi:hypothetical protein
MANALTGLALYSALAEQVYRRAREKGKTDQPLAVGEDGSKLEAENLVTGQELVDPKLVLKLNTDPLTKDRFRFDNNYMYNTATGFVAMVTKGTDDKFTVTFRGTDAGDASQWTCATATLFEA